VPENFVQERERERERGGGRDRDLVGVDDNDEPSSRRDSIEREREREKRGEERAPVAVTERGPPFHETQSERCNYMRNTHTTKRNATAAIA